jgi:thioester reductase-like protein
VSSSLLAAKMAEHAYIGYDLGFGNYDSSKLSFVYGNITNVGLGLSDSDIASITAANVTVIVHCAGVVDTLAPYSAQKHVNVMGVKHISKYTD